MKEAFKIVNALTKAGHKAYIVGGAVRDKLLGLSPKDIDIVTCARPEHVLEVAFENNWTAKKFGASFGVINILMNGKLYEVATTRTECYGKDSHRPEKVEYVSDIYEDLARRDFTINAMAMDVNGNVFDPFGGREDLKRQIIRTVGNPEERFSEDGLRPFRAIRLAAQYRFSIEDITLSAIPRKLDRVCGLSVERVRDELESILLAPYAATGLDLLVETGLAGATCSYKEKGSAKQVGILPECEDIIGLEQNPKYHTYDVWNHTLAVVASIPAERTLRWAALLHDIAKGSPDVRCLNKQGDLADYGHDRKGAEMAFNIMGRLKVPSKITQRVSWIVRNHMSLPEPNKEKVIKWLRKQSRNFKTQSGLKKAMRQLLVLCRADIKGGMINPDFSKLDALTSTIEEILETTPFYPNELAISGGLIAKELGAGPQVSHFLDGLLIRIQTGQLENEEEELYNALLKKKEKLQKSHPL